MGARFRRYIGTASLIFIVISTMMTRAQDAADSPLLALLAHIPDMVGNRSFITYADRGAIEAAYPGTRAPEDWAEFDAINNIQGENPDLLPVEAWWRIFMNMAVPTSQNFGFGETIPTVMGFDYFDIDRELSYGTPPEAGLLLQGEFDEDALRAALEARGFTVDRSAEDAEIWCGSVGCDGGTQTDLRSVDRANLFGGDLGRQQPIFITDNVLMSSPNMVQVLALYDGVTAGGVTTLSVDQGYRAAVGAVSDLGIVLQASIVDREILGGDEFALAFSSTEPGAFDTLIEGFETIAPYSLLVMADVVSEDEQIGAAAFVYLDRAQAESAVAEMARRLQTMTSLRTGQLYADLLKDRRATIETQVVERDGLAVALVLLTTPKATADQIVLFRLDTPPDQLPEVTAPSLLYRFLLEGVNARDNLWYSTVPRQVLEGMTGQ